MPEGLDLMSYCEEIGFPANRFGLVGSRQEFSQVEDAWYCLYTNGYGELTYWWRKGSKTVCALCIPCSRCFAFAVKLEMN